MNGIVHRALLSLMVSRPVPARSSTSDMPLTQRRPICPKTPVRSSASKSTPAFAAEGERGRLVVEIVGVAEQIGRRRHESHVGLVDEPEADRAFAVGAHLQATRRWYRAQPEVEREGSDSRSIARTAWTRRIHPCGVRSASSDWNVKVALTSGPSSSM